MEALATTSKLLLEVGRAFAGLRDYFRDDESFQILARDLGWDLAELPAPLANLLPVLEQLETSLLDLVEEPSLATLTAARTALAAAYAALQGLARQAYTFATVDVVAFKNEFPQQVINLLLIEYLSQHHARLYGVLLGMGLITLELVPPTPSGRLVYLRKSFNLQALGSLLHKPTDSWQALYGWGTDFAYDRLLLALTEMLCRLGWAADTGNADYNLLALVNPLPLPVPLPRTKAAYVSLFDRDTNLGALHLSAQLLPVLDAAGTPQGLALAVQALGALATTIDLGNRYELALTGGASLAGGVGVQVQPGQGVSLRSLASAGGAVSGKVEVALSRRPAGVAGTPQRLLRTPGNTELTYESITWKVGALASTTAAADLYTELKINALRFAAGDGDSDSFLSQVLKNFYFKTDLSVGLSKAKGFYFDSAGGLSTKQKKTFKLGPVQLNNVAFAVETVNAFTYLTVASDLVAELGPLTASLSGVGLKAGIKYDANGGDIGPFSTDITVQGPSGVGITVQSDVLTGGGYLYLDAAHHKYAGAATLQLKLGKADINLNALGLLQTELLGHPDAYSLLLLITATFTPIQLGLGFTLNGVGGLLGINRAADTSYLRGLVRQGQLDKLLFPANVMANPTDALATVDQAFPATEGRYIIGLMGRLGWGVPTSLLTLDVALLVELPAPVRLLILGVLQASLPSKTNELLKLRADFLGSIDFGAKKVAFDAALSESRILVYSLSGDMAFRFYQGANPVFLLTAGGFHPSFQPPASADLPALRRLTLALAQGGNLRLTLASYFAVTSNTVQFGARLDLYFNLRLGLHVEGHFGLDTLFQFSPFRLEAHMEAGVAIKRGNSELLGLHLSLNVTGPGPWHVWGSASFRIWFVKISVDVNGYIGSATPAPALPAPDVRTPLLAALASPSAWEVVAPAPALPGGVALRPAAVAAGQLFLDPRGALALRQHVAPLGVQLEKYGNDPTAPTGGRRFDLLSLQVGSRTYAAGTAGVEAEREFFAPDQFRRLSEAQRLSLPSFQLLPSGLRVSSLGGFARAGAATRRVVTYEQLLYQGAATGTAAGGTLAPLAGAQPSARRLGQLARGSALGRAVQASQPSARAAQPVGWAETAYAVVAAATLLPYLDPVSNKAQDHFDTQVQAEQYCRAQPAAAELLVVPAYQLALA